MADPQTVLAASFFLTAPSQWVSHLPCISHKCPLLSIPKALPSSNRANFPLTLQQPLPLPPASRLVP